MISEENIAKKVAELLLQIKAIKLNTKNHFIWASGWHSPIYCDNRILLSYPNERKKIAQLMAQQIKEKFGKPDLIASVATGAIGIGMLVSEVLHLPMVYVRPQPKNHGKKNQIEGLVIANQRTVVIEDLISTGESSLNAVEALSKKGLNVLGMVAIFSYELSISQSNFKQKQLPLYTLSNYPQLLQKALEMNYIKSSELNELDKWRISPDSYKK